MTSVFSAQPTTIGGIHLGARDFALLARHMCRVVFCPRANQILATGNFRGTSCMTMASPLIRHRGHDTSPRFQFMARDETLLERTRE